MEERNITTRYSKSNFGMTSVTWFRSKFSATGMSADPEKIQSNIKAGRPQNNEDVKSFLQACQFNANFIVESEQAYAQITAPMRALTRKNVKFQWTRECEEAYKSIVKAMSNDTALRPYDPKLNTELGIAASIFQECQDGTWIPVDHASRSLTQCEQKYSQIEKKSLAQAWGMTTHRYYLLGIPFESHTDHQPPPPPYIQWKTKRKCTNRTTQIKVTGLPIRYEIPTW